MATMSLAGSNAESWYDAMATVGRQLFEDRCCQLNVNCIDAARQAGVADERFRHFQQGQTVSLTGKEWFRLMTAVGISMNEWLAGSRRQLGEAASETDTANPLTEVSRFFLAASEKVLSKEAESPHLSTLGSP
jgi:hypothetical protein